MRIANYPLFLDNLKTGRRPNENNPNLTCVPLQILQVFHNFWELPLDWMVFLNGYEVKEIVRKTSKEVFGMDPEVGSNHYMPGMKHSFDYCKWAFNQRSSSADRPVSPFVFYGDWFSPDRSFHSFVYWCERDSPKISFVTVHRFAFLREIDLAIMQWCGGSIESSDELVFFVDDGMKFVSKFWFVTFPGPGSIPASSGLCSISPWFIGRGMPGIGGDERCILNGAPSYRISLFIQLALKFIPNEMNFAIFCQVFPEYPHRRPIRYFFRIPEKMPKW